MKNEILKKLFGKKEKNKEIKHPEKIKNFDSFLYIEVIDYLGYIRDLMNPTNTTAGLLAKTDATINGFSHGLLMSDTQNVSCSCCAFWCSGATCPIVKEAWQFFLEEVSNYKVLLVKTGL